MIEMKIFQIEVKQKESKNVEISRTASTLDLRIHGRSLLNSVLTYNFAVPTNVKCFLYLKKKTEKEP